MLFLPASAAPPTDAEVTIYSNGSLASAVLMPGEPKVNHAAFIGLLFDGDQKIGFIQPNRFLTLRLPTGQHTFSASLSSKHPAKDSQLPLVLNAGEKYFIRVQEESRGVVFASAQKGRLDLVTCQIAHQDAANASPTDSKRIAPEMRDKIIPTRSMPPCE
jgi:hypothetical protein